MTVAEPEFLMSLLPEKSLDKRRVRWHKMNERSSISSENTKANTRPPPCHIRGKEITRPGNISRDDPRPEPAPVTVCEASVEVPHSQGGNG